MRTGAATATLSPGVGMHDAGDEPGGVPLPEHPRGRHRAPAPALPRLVRSAWIGLASPLILVLGAWIRVFQWYGDRSLWLDEALIARSLVSRGYVSLVAEPLQGDQAAPTLWLWLSRLSIDLFGTGERALRLVPLLAGIAALVLSWRLAARLLPAVLVPVPVVVVALSPAMIYYSNEVKPYSLDVAVVLAVLLLALRVPTSATPRQLVPLTLAGAAAVWASFASVFVLAAVSVVLVLSQLLGPSRRRRAGRRPRVRSALATATVLSLWVVSLGASYLAVLRRLRSSTILSDYWAYSFPDDAGDLPTWLVRRGVDLVHDPLELTVWPLAVLLLVLGSRRLAAAQGRRWLLATGGVAVALLAAAASAYPFASRLALWTVPLAAVALAAVLPATLERGVALLLSVTALAVVAAPAAAEGLSRAADVGFVGELRPVMEQVAATKRPGDLVLVDIAAKAPFDFYTDSTGLGRDGVILFATDEEVGGACNDPQALRTGRFATERVWVVFAHRLADTRRLGTREDLVARIEDVTSPAGRIEEPGAEAILFDPSAPRAPVSNEPRNPDRCLAVVRTVPPTG